MDISSLQSNLAHKQTATFGHRLLHFSAEEFFCPHLSVSIHSRSIYAKFFGLRAMIFATWAMLLIGAVFLYRHSSQLSWIEHWLEDYSVMTPRQHISSQPVTITTTIYKTSGTRWHFDVPTGIEYVSSPAVTTPASTTVTSPTAVHETTFSSLSTRVDDGSLVPMLSSIAASIEDYALLPLQYLSSFSWSMDDLRPTLNKFMETLEIVWEVFRRVYHYPLDPP